MTTDTANFADAAPLTYQVRQPAAPAIHALAATRKTRIVYCLALAGTPLAMLGASSSWVGLVFGGGPMRTVGPVGFFLIAAAVLYRMYMVVRYPIALDAPPPNHFGQFASAVAWIFMAVGATGTAGLLLGGPLAGPAFDRTGPEGIVVFAAAVMTVLMASVGWIGCALFEASRLAGTAAPSLHPGMARQRSQDWAVLVTLTVLAVVPPVAFKRLNGEPCFELAACAARIEGGVARRVAVPLGVPVVLQTNIDAIEYQQMHGPNTWVRTEFPAFSLLRAGHPVAATPAGPVQVSLQATAASEGVTVALTVRENGEQTARFTTQFAADARTVPSSDGASKLVVVLPRGVVTSRQEGQGEGTLDALFQQMRAAIGSPREVAEEAKRVAVTAEPLGSSELDNESRAGSAPLASNCAGLVQLEDDGQAEYEPVLARPMSELVLVQQPDPRVTVLLRWEDEAVCTGGGVWLAQSRQWREGLLELRKYDMQGSLRHSLLVSVPAVPSPEDYSLFIHRKLVERDGAVEFAYETNTGNRRRLERYRVKL